MKHNPLDNACSALKKKKDQNLSSDQIAAVNEFLNYIRALHMSQDDLTRFNFLCAKLEKLNAAAMNLVLKELASLTNRLLFNLAIPVVS